MDRLWRVGEADVTQVTESIGHRRRRSRNTIQSTLERLVRKGLVAREKRGRAYHYRTEVSREALLGRALEGLIEQVPGAEPRLLFASFVALAERSGPATLEELEALIRKRRQLEGKR